MNKINPGMILKHPSGHILKVREVHPDKDKFIMDLYLDGELLETHQHKISRATSKFWEAFGWKQVA